MAEERYLTNGDSGSLFQDKFNWGITGFYNVKRYGALGDDVQDDTPYIQAAINDCWQNGGGVVFFPNGIYRLESPLVTNVDGQNPNCQLYIQGNSFGMPPKNIKFLGESAYFGPSLLISIPLPTECVILNSVIDGSGTAPAVIGGVNSTISFGHYFINALFDFENIVITTKHGANGPTVGGINGQNFHNSTFRNISVTPNIPTVSTNEPTADVFGIRTFETDGGTFSRLDQCFVSGYKWAYVFGELASGTTVVAYGNKNAFTFAHSNHTIHFQRMIASGNINTLVADEFWEASPGDSRVQIDNITVERGNYGEWYSNDPVLNAPSYLVDDPNNRLYGTATYGIITQGSGFNPDPTLANKNGGTNFTITSMP